MNKRKARLQFWYKIGMVIFLAMIILGFMVPGFINTDSSETFEVVEPRLCSSDSDCFLMCDTPQTVLCTQNLCVQNSCEEGNAYRYNTQPTSFTLKINVGGDTLDLSNRSQAGSLFATFTGETVLVYSQGLPLNLILEKVQLGFLGTCLRVDGTSFCNGDAGAIDMEVNGESNLEYGFYIPQEGDSIEIIAS